MTVTCKIEKDQSVDKKFDCATKSYSALCILAINIDHLLVVSLCQYTIMIFLRFNLHSRDNLKAAYIL